MAMVEYFANPPTCSLGNLASSLGRADANVLPGDDRALSDIACGVDGVEGDEIARTFSDPLGRCSGSLGGTFACVPDAATDVAAGAALLGLGGWLSLGGWLGCFSRLSGLWLGGLGILAGCPLATDGEG